MVCGLPFLLVLTSRIETLPSDTQQCMPLPAIPNCCSTALFRQGTISLSCEVSQPQCKARPSVHCTGASLFIPPHLLRRQLTVRSSRRSASPSSASTVSDPAVAESREQSTADHPQQTGREVRLSTKVRGDRQPVTQPLSNAPGSPYTPGSRSSPTKGLAPGLRPVEGR
jgi:hypothetical protein